MNLPFPYGRIAILITGAAFLASKAAEIAPDSWWQPLIQGGSTGAVLGAMCYFLAVRMERKMDESNKAQMEMARALNHASKSNLLVVLALRSLDGNLASMAQNLANEIEQEL